MPVSLRLSQQQVIALCAGLLSLSISLWQLTIPSFLSFYDSGVYFAGAIHLVSGVLPYRNFVFVQPPGILLILSPLALLSRYVGSHDGFILARALSALVTALNVGMLAWLVRRRGRGAMLIAGFTLALLPVASFVSSSVKLEPYCIFFVLLGSSVIFANDPTKDQLTNRRLVIGGLLFGVAGLIKLWAFFPFIALVVCLLPSCRRRTLILLGTAGGAFIVPSLPFLVMAPKNFISEVLIEQLTRKAHVGDTLGIMGRLAGMTGFGSTTIAPSTATTVVIYLGLLCAIAIGYARRMNFEVIDLFLLLTAAITAAGILLAAEWYPYYGYFPAPFLLGLVAVSLARLGNLLRKSLSQLNIPVVFVEFRLS